MLPVFSFTKAALELFIWLNERFEFENGDVGLKALLELFEETWDLVFYPGFYFWELLAFFWLFDFDGYYI